MRVSAGLCFQGEKIWIFKRGPGRKNAHLWEFPGGKEESGETPAGCLVRELREELGLQARPEELILCGVRRFEYESAFHGRPFHDNQVSRVYALWRDVEPEALTLQKEEVERVDWMDYDRCVQGVSEGSFPNCIRMDELEMLRHAWAVDSGTNCTNL